MDSKKKTKGRFVFLWAFEVILICVSISILIALGNSFEEIRENDYIALGFWKTILLIIQDKTLQKMSTGLFVATFLISCRILWLMMQSKYKTSLDFINNWSQSYRSYAIVFLVSFLGIVSRIAFFRTPCRDEIFFSVIISFLCCILFSIFWKAQQIFRKVSWIQNPFFQIDFYGGCLLVVLAASLMKVRTLKLFIENIEICIALIVSGFVFILWICCCLFPLYAVFTDRDSSSRKSLRSLYTVSVLLFIICVIPGLCAVLSPYIQRQSLKPAHPWNVVLIGIDTLRADHTSLASVSNKKHNLTPNLAKLASKGTVFQNAISQAPWTMPAFASILTGQYPHEHGAVSLQGKLKRRVLTLAEILQEAGFLTSAVVSHSFIDTKHGFSQGFSNYNEDNILKYRGVTSENITNTAIEILDKHGQKNFFLFLHYFDPHYKYQNHSEWDFADSYSGWLLEEFPNIKNLRAKRHFLESPDIKYLVDLYDEDIAYTDKHLGRFFQYLKKRKLDQNTIIIVVADHGEEFMERGWLGHTISLYEEQIKVPLLIVLPEFEHKNPLVGRTVETRNLFPTILDYLGFPDFIKSSSQSLLPMLETEEPEKAENSFHNLAYSSVWLPDAPVDSGKRVKITAIRSDRWKLIVDHTRQKEFFYNLEKDPKEKKNLSSKETDILRKMRGSLQKLLKQAEQGSSVPDLDLSQEEINRLKSLGYF